MENFYEELYQYLIERGIDDDEATEVVNYLYEDNIHEYGLLTENKGRHFLNMLRAVGYMSGVLKKPGARQAVKQVIPKVQQGTPLQGNLLTKKGTAQNFTGGRMPFTGTSPVPAASSPLPQPAAPAPQAPGQMRIPGLSSRAQELRNVTGNPNLGLPGNTQGFAVAGGNIANRSKSILRAQPQRTAPGLPQPPASPAAPKNNLAKVAIPVGVAGATGLALSGGQPPKKGEDPRRPDGSLPPYTPPRPAAAPAPAPKAETPKEEPVRRPASKLTSAAKDFDRAFAAARKEGKKEFTWRGKQYNTKYKGE